MLSFVLGILFYTCPDLVERRFDTVDAVQKEETKLLKWSESK